MGIDVELRRIIQTGTSPKKRIAEPVRECPDSDNVLSKLLRREANKGRTPMLDRVDPYGSLELASAEMAQLTEELNVIGASIENIAEAAMVGQLASLARDCQRDPRSVLRFEGD